MARSNALEAEDLEQLEQNSGSASAIRETPPGADWNPIEEAFLRRRSVRKYKTRQVPAHLIRRMLEIGRFAPSQGNSQAWKFVVVRDKKLIERMEQYCVDEFKKMSPALDYTLYPQGSLRRWFTRLKARLLNRLDHNMLHPVPMTVLTSIAEGRFAVFHKAPTVILLLVDRRGVGCPEIDIGIVGLGWVSFAGNKQNIRVSAPKGIAVYVQPAKI